MTTLMALLMRFYDPLEGTIRLDGHDLRTLKQSSIRRQIGVVLQDPLLFNDSVRANIAYGRPDATLAEIEAAARAARSRFPSSASCFPMASLCASGRESFASNSNAP